MTTLHLFNIDTLKTNFQSILKTQYDIQSHKKVIQEKLNELKTIYNGLVKTNTKKIFLFCLDSFYFQYKTLMIEMDNLSKFSSLINNRIYGDYYKLYNIILLQTAESNVDVRGLMSDFTKKYPVYKDLEPFYEYKNSCIIDIHADILKLVNYLYTHYSGKEQNIHGYNTNTKVGTSINSFMQTLEYENTLLREQIGLYISYITFFHSSHSGYLTKLSLKIQNFQKEIEEEIMVNHNGVGSGGGGEMEGESTVSLEDVQELTDSEFGTFLNLPEDAPTEIEILLRESEAALESGENIIHEFEKEEKDSSIVNEESVDQIPERSEDKPSEISQNAEVPPEN
jgi:hypothetical protein